MRKALLSIISLSICCFVFADLLTMSIMKSVVPIIDENGITNATGVLFSKNDELYLITNKHVLENDKQMGFMMFRTEEKLVIKEPILIENTNITLLKDDIDIACVKLPNNIEKKILESNYLLTIDISNLMTDSIQNTDYYGPGDDVLVIGYPLNPQLKELYNKEKVFNFYPIVRTGIISSFNDFDTNGFLVNCEILGGNSGSLIITKPSNSRLTTKGIEMGAKSYIYGIASSSMYLGQENTGISKAIDYNAIKLIIDKASK